MNTTPQKKGSLFSFLGAGGNIAMLAILMTSFLAVAESHAAVERYKVEADFLTRLAQLGYNTVDEGFESNAWDNARSPNVNDTNTLPQVLSQGILWEPASTDVFGQTAVTGVTTNQNWARSGQWGLFETQTPFL